MSEKEETLESQATVHFTLPLFQKIIALVYPKLLFFFPATLHDMWDFSSPTRDRIRLLCTGNVES